MNKITSWALRITWSAFLLGLAGCATGPRTVSLTGEDHLPAGQTARLEVPYTLDILSVDGDDFAPGMTLKVHRGHRLVLAPGPHTITVRYRDFFETNTDDMVRVEGQPRRMSFELRKGRVYTIRHPSFDDPEEARSALNNMPLRIEEQRTGRIESKTETVPNPRARFALVGEAPKNSAAALPMTDEDMKPAAPAETESEGISSIDLLKFWWNKATEEERSAFRKWIEP